MATAGWAAVRVRSLRLAPVAVALLAVTLLAGCSSGGGVATLSEGAAQAAMGTNNAQANCSGSGMVSVSVAGQAGSVHFTVRDAANVQVYDSGLVSGNSASTSQSFTVKAGTWTLQVQRNAFTGSYSATMTC